jgi:hypothetical protein
VVVEVLGGHHPTEGACVRFGPVFRCNVSVHMLSLRLLRLIPIALW